MEVVVVIFYLLGETMKVSLEYAQMGIEMKISCQKSSWKTICNLCSHIVTPPNN